MTERVSLDRAYAHGRIKLRDNRVYQGTPKNDVLIRSPCSIELSVITNYFARGRQDHLRVVTGDHHEEEHRSAGLRR